MSKSHVIYPRKVFYMNDKGTDQTTYSIEGSEVYNKAYQHYYITLEVFFA